jgi:hypothetical protein
MQKFIGGCILALMLMISCSKEKVYAPQPPVPTPSDPVPTPIREEAAIFPFCQPFVISTLNLEAEVPIFASTNSSTFRPGIKPSNLSIRMISGPGAAQVQAITSHFYEFQIARLTNLSKGDYVFETTVSYNNTKAIDSFQLIVVQDTLANKEYQFNTSWVYNDDWYPYQMLLEIPRTDLFFTSGNRKLEVRMRLANSVNWISINAEPLVGEKYFYKVETCGRTLQLFPADHKDISLINVKAEVRIKFF